MNEWLDDDGRPLGHWEEVTRDDYIAIKEAAGGVQCLDVFATLTDPDGVYGPKQVYTAWGIHGHDVPLIDRRTENLDDDEPTDTFRKFVAAAPVEEKPQ